MTIAAPMIDLLCGTPTHDDCAVRVHFVEQLSDRAGGPREIAEPLVQPAEAVAAGLSGSSLGPAMYPSSDIDM